MKIIIPLTYDSDNTNPGEIEVVGTSSRVTFRMQWMDRAIEMDLEDLEKIVKLFKNPT